MGPRHQLAEALRRAREAAGLQQQEAAERLDVHPVTVSNWERGKNVPRDDALAEIAALYGTTPAALRYGTHEQPPTGGEAGTGAAGESDELRQHPAYWRGRQDELVGMMEYVGRMMREATVMHDRALATQREIIARTTPVPHDMPPPGGGGGQEPITEYRRSEGQVLRPPARDERPAKRPKSA